jgi:hypothetical protein
MLLSTGIDPQVMADLEEAARYAASGVRDPEVMRQHRVPGSNH